MTIKIGPTTAPATTTQPKATPSTSAPRGKGPEGIGSFFKDVFEHVGAFLRPANDPKEPALDNPGFERYENRDEPLDVNGIDLGDVKQGTIGDCYFVCSVAGIVNARPDVIKNAMHENADGTVTFRFYQRNDPNDASQGFHAVDETVDRKVVVDLLGGSPVGHSQDRELWFPLMEKAYAQLKGDSYQTIGHGGYPNDALEALLGQPSQYVNGDADEIYSRLSDDTKNGLAVSAWTGPNSVPSNTGVVNDHAYTVLGTSEENGQRYVTVRNPWGFFEPGAVPEIPLPFASDGKNDGVFRLPLDKFVQYFPYCAECQMPPAT